MTIKMYLVGSSKGARKKSKSQEKSHEKNKQKKTTENSQTKKADIYIICTYGN